MAGNKTITGIAFAAIITLAITACKFQPPGYGGLYVDNLMPISDTTDSEKTLPNFVDTHEFDTTSYIETDLPVLHPDKEIFKIFSDSVYQKNFEQAVKAITDSIQLLRYQMIELQKQLTVVPDTSFTGENSQEFQLPDSLQTEVDLKQLLQAQNDTIVVLRKQLKELKNSGNIKSDTVNVTNEIVKSPVTESQQIDNLTQELLKAKDEQIQMLQNKLNALQNESSVPD
jgi:hypothetical protein